MAILIAAAVVLAVAIAWVARADRLFYQQFTRTAAAFRDAASTQAGAPITDADLQQVPEPLARYMRFSGVVGRPPITAVRVWHSGRFRTSGDKPWMAIAGEYSITTSGPSFVWYGKVRLVPGITMAALDSYGHGHGRMLVKALSAIPIVDAQSPQTTHSAFGRCVAEMCLAPTFFLDRRHVRCTQTGPDRVRCAVTDGDLTTDADLFVNADGSLDRIVVMRYFDRGHGAATRERFTGQSSTPKTFGGLRLGSHLDGIWNLAEGDLHYVAFDVERVEVE